MKRVACFSHHQSLNCIVIHSHLVTPPPQYDAVTTSSDNVPLYLATHATAHTLQVSVLEQVSRGDAMLATARRCLKLMSSFVDQQRAAAAPGGSAALLPVAGMTATAAAAAAGAAGAGVSGPAAATTPVELGFEMVCALINNSVDCYNQSLQFTQNVQVWRGGLHVHC